MLHEAGHRQVAARSWRRAQLAVCVHHAPSHEHCVRSPVGHEALEQVAVHTRVVRRSMRGKADSQINFRFIDVCINYVDVLSILVYTDVIL